MKIRNPHIFDIYIRKNIFTSLLEHLNTSLEEVINSEETVIQHFQRSLIIQIYATNPFHDRLTSPIGRNNQSISRTGLKTRSTFQVIPQFQSRPTPGPSAHPESV